MAHAVFTMLLVFVSAFVGGWVLGMIASEGENKFALAFACVASVFAFCITGFIITK